VTRIPEPAGRALTFHYTGTNLQVDQVTDPLGRTVRYGYGEFGVLTSVTDPAGGVTRYTYTGGGLATITDPRGIPFLTNEYDGDGRLGRQTQADGGLWRFGYETRTDLVSFAGTVCRPGELVKLGNAYFPCPGDTRGRVVAASVLDPRGQLTRSRFNETGYLVSQTDALGQTTTFERAPGSNLLLSTTDPLGRVTRYTYDATGNVTTITDPLGNPRTFTYEPTFNTVTSITDPLGNVMRFSYDAQGNLTETTDPLGNLTRMAYNAFGRSASATDRLGNTTTFGCSAEGELVTTELSRDGVRQHDLQGARVL
jgi:YD repeat-containing protein